VSGTRAAVAGFGGAVLGGVLYFTGYLGFGVWPCLMVFLVPLWRSLERADSWRRAAGVGLAFGWTAFAGGFLWLWPLVDAFLGGSHLAGFVLWLGYGTWFALEFVVYALLFHLLRARGWALALAGVAPLVAIEWLQPQVFPLYAGAGLIGAPVLVQTADLGGPLLLTALLAGANVAACETWTWWCGLRARPLGAWVVALAVSTLVAGYGVARVRSIDAAAPEDAPALRVGLVQANLGVLEKRRQSVLTHRRHLEQTRELLAEGPVDLVVWPETAYVRGLRRPLPLSGRPIVDDVAVPLLFGSASVRDEDGRLVKANSVFLVGADGMIRSVYDKNLLIPLSEYLPLRDRVPALARWFPDVQEFTAAHDAPAVALGPWRIATPICYEAIRPEFVRRMVRASKPHLLVTLANDAWFGDSQEPWLHLGLARLRAVEHRRYLVRATNSGISAIVDPAGRITVRSGVLARENLRGTVRFRDGETIYGRAGDWPGVAATAAVILGLCFRRRRSQPSAPPGPSGSAAAGGPSRDRPTGAACAAADRRRRAGSA
jgi:apolipoprotein N-acyltransferase